MKVVIQMKQLISLLNYSYDGRKSQKRFLLALNAYLAIKLIQFINFLFNVPFLQSAPTNVFQVFHLMLILFVIICFFIVRPLRTIKRIQWNFLTITLRWKFSLLSLKIQKILKEVI
ncbi:TPA: hypothetical protein RHJ99_001880 [Enterococcus faecalis]|nr:hypothetical protein [Enterococcus faecalis]